MSLHGKQVQISTIPLDRLEKEVVPKTQSHFQEPVLDIQRDATLDPGLSPVTGDRYIITNSAALHANFGAIANIGDDDIVEYNGTDFEVVYDASVEGEGAIAWVDSLDDLYKFTGGYWSSLAGGVKDQLAAQYNNILYVDPVLGNDTIAQPNAFNLPYATVSAALTASASGDLVYVNSGTLTPEINLLKDGVDQYYEPGTSMTIASGGIFKDLGANITCKIFGKGTFIHTNQNFNLDNDIINLFGISNVDFEAQFITSWQTWDNDDNCVLTIRNTEMDKGGTNNNNHIVTLDNCKINKGLVCIHRGNNVTWNVLNCEFDIADGDEPGAANGLVYAIGFGYVSTAEIHDDMVLNLRNTKITQQSANATALSIAASNNGGVSKITVINCEHESNGLNSHAVDVPTTIDSDNNYEFTFQNNFTTAETIVSLSAAYQTRFGTLVNSISEEPIFRKRFSDSRPIKSPVRLVSTGNVDVTTGGLISVDGVLTVAEDRVLLNSQTAPAENGIWIATTGAWKRAPELDSAEDVNSGFIVTVQEGNTQGDSLWILSTDTFTTFGTDPINFVRLDGGGVTLANGSGTTANGLGVDLGGTLTSAANILGGAFAMSLGTSGSKLGGLDVYVEDDNFQVLLNDTTGATGATVYMEYLNNVANSENHFFQIDKSGIQLATTSSGTDFNDSLVMLLDGIEVQLSSTHTFRYAADYSANFTSRSIPDVAWVLNVASGITPKKAVKYATTAALPDTPTYDNGTAGVGATLTGTGVTQLTVDGVIPASGDRLLIKDQASALQNGVYDVTNNDGVSAWVLTRSTDFDNSPDNEIDSGYNVFVTAGNTQAATSWIIVTDYDVIGDLDGKCDVGTDAIDWSQYSAGVSYTFGDGLSETAGNVAVDLAANSGLTFATGQLTIDSAIAGSGLDWTTGVLSVSPINSSDKEQNPLAVIIDNGPTGITLSNTPVGLLVVIVNGEVHIPGDGVKTTNCYFSNDAGITARSYANIVSGDELIWNALISSFSLAITDVISLVYVSA